MHRIRTYVCNIRTYDVLNSLFGLLATYDVGLHVIQPNDSRRVALLPCAAMILSIEDSVAHIVVS